VTAAAPATRAGSPGLIGRLRAELRPQFAVPVILADQADPVMGGPSCKVPVCERVAVLTGMCTAHHQRWAEAGRPDAGTWAASAAAVRRWLGEPAGCAVTACRRARCEFSLCHSHVARWEHAGRPDRARWIADGGGGLPLPRTPACRFHECGLDSEGAAGLCQVHRARWARNGRPPVEAWLADCAMFGLDRFDLRALPMPMRLEIAYAIQRRVDARRTRTRPDQVRALLRKLAVSGASSLLDRPADDWNASLGFSSRHGDSERRFLLDAIGYLRDLAEGAGWDTEYPRDVWLLRRLGYDGRDAVLRFDRIEAAWLRELTKRWARWRLSTGTALSTVLADVRAITGFARSLPSLQRGPEALTRDLIEVHLAHLVTSFPNPKRPAAGCPAARLGTAAAAAGRSLPGGLSAADGRRAPGAARGGDDPAGTGGEPGSLRRPGRTAAGPDLDGHRAARR
jgi:hypothetical protein